MYGGVNAAVKTILSKLDIEVTWLEDPSVENYRKAVKGNTKVSTGPMDEIIPLETRWKQNMANPAVYFTNTIKFDHMLLDGVWNLCPPCSQIVSLHVIALS